MLLINRIQIVDFWLHKQHIHVVSKLNKRPFDVHFLNIRYTQIILSELLQIYYCHFATILNYNADFKIKNKINILVIFANIGNWLLGKLLSVPKRTMDKGYCVRLIRLDFIRSVPE